MNPLTTEEIDLLDQWARKSAKQEDETIQRIRMLICAAAFDKLHGLYQKRGYTEDVYESALADLRSWIDRNIVDYGRPGLMDRAYTWEMSFASGYTIPCGRFQFQMAGPVKEDIPQAGLHAGDNIVQLHIPDHGGPLTPEVCIRSFHRILDTIRKCHPDYDVKAFCIGSWLLDPIFSELIPDSNLAKFGRFGHFRILPYDETQETIWRVYGNKGIDGVPHTTRLQKLLAPKLKNGYIVHGGSFILTKDEIEQHNYTPDHKG